MGLLTWIIVGLIAGWLAGVVVKGSGYGFWNDMLLGIIGALIGGFAARAVVGNPDPLIAINPGTIVVAFLGAVTIVVIARLLSSRRAF